MNRPMIGVAGMPSPKVTGLRRRGVAAAEQVLEAVFRAGGEPLVLFPSTGPVDELLGRLDGVLLPGGADVSPAAYGQDGDHPEIEAAEPEQDRFEFAIARHAIERRTPLLAICRGMQVLNVALGGDLIPHIEERDVPHRDAFHDVLLDDGTRIAEVMAGHRVAVSSYHHQALGRLGDGLVVTGRAPDGVIEAIEHTLAPVLAVQWHPEDNAAQAPEQQALFNAHVELSRLVQPACP